MINRELLQLTLDSIKENPQHWNQSQWHCGTTHCFAGFAEVLGLGLPLTIDESNFNNTRPNAIRLLGLTELQANTLFYGSNTLEDLERIVYYLK